MFASYWDIRDNNILAIINCHSYKENSTHSCIKKKGKKMLSNWFEIFFHNKDISSPLNTNLKI
jgi:hypothetical protein